VQGAGIDDTQIVGEMDPAYANVQYNALKVFASFYQNYASLEDLSITSVGSNNSCALWGFEEESLHLKNLRMHELSPDLFAVINISRASNILWDNITIEDITTDDKGLLFTDGYITGAIRNSVFRNASSTFNSNEVWAKPLIWADLGENITIENTIFTDLSMADDDTEAISFGSMSNPSGVQFYDLQNCLFSNISCNESGVFIAGHAYPEINIINCTFAGHTGNGEALMVNGNVSITNCIFYNDRSVEIAINPMDGTGIPTTLTLNNNLIRNGYSDIWQGPGSTVNYSDTNITGNPFFLGVNEINNPFYYRLSSASPCINAGTVDTTGFNLLPYDLAGNWRIWNNRIDMGAFEYGSEPWVSIDDPDLPAIDQLVLKQNYPNPFNPTTTIAYSLPEASKVRLDIYNVKGQLVKTLVNAEMSAGMHSVVWNGRDSNNAAVASGVYFYRVSSPKATQTKRMLLMK